MKPRDDKWVWDKYRKQINSQLMSETLTNLETASHGFFQQRKPPKHQKRHSTSLAKDHEEPIKQGNKDISHHQGMTVKNRFSSMDNNKFTTLKHPSSHKRAITALTGQRRFETTGQNSDAQTRAQTAKTLGESGMPLPSAIAGGIRSAFDSLTGSMLIRQNFNPTPGTVTPFLQHTGPIDILNPQIDFFDGLDTYVNTKLNRDDTLKKRREIVSVYAQKRPAKLDTITPATIGSVPQSSVNLKSSFQGKRQIPGSTVGFSIGQLPERESQETIVSKVEEQQSKKMKRSNTDDASTTMSEYSNAPEVMREFIRAQTNKQGKKVIPRYLKDDFPDNTLIPCKQLIANLPSHIDRPPAEKFDELVIKVFKGMRKPPKKVSKKQKKTSQSQETQGGTAALKNRQSELEIKNMHEQLASDQQYKAMFGGDELIIKRHYRIKQPQQPIINAEDESELSQLQVIVPPPRLNIESQIEFSKAEILSRQMRSMSSGGLGIAMSSQKQQETATILSDERQEVPNSMMSGSKNILSNVTLNIPKEQVASFQTNQTNKSKSNKYKVELDNQELIVKMPLGPDGQKVKPPQFYSKFSKYAQNEKKPPSFIPIPEDFFSKAIQKPKSKSISGGVISMADLSRPLTTMYEANQRVGFGRSPISPKVDEKYTYGSIKANKRVEIKLKPKSYIPMMLDYLECKIGHRSSKKVPIENSLVSPQAVERIAQSLAETEQGYQFLTSPNVQVQQDKDENWENVKKFYKVEFKEGENLKRPLINPDKRKMLSTLMKNDHLTIKNIHNHMLEKIVYQK